MPSQEQIDQEAGGSDLEQRVAVLEDTIATLRRNLLEPAMTRPGTLRYGANQMQLDNNGIQINVVANHARALWFLPQFYSDPTDATTYGTIYGNIANSTDPLVTMAALNPNANAVWTTRVSTTDAGWISSQVASAGGIAGMNWIIASSASYAEWAWTNTYLKLTALATDPGLNADGQIAYYNNKLYARINGATVELGGGGSMPMPPIVGTVSWNCLGAELAAMKSSVTTAAASTAWPAANRAIYIPVKVTEDCTVTKLWVYNGATASGNINMCLYNSSFAQVANTEIGSTAQSGTNVVQEFDITNTALTAGLYYIACVFSSGTGTAWAFATSGDTPVELLQSWGMAQEAIGSVDLPATATPAAIASAFIPFVGMSISPRTLVT